MEKDLKALLNKRDDILFAYLFGSQVTGNTNSESDVDVAVYISEEKKYDFLDIRLELIEEVNRCTKKEADVTILNEAPPFLRFVVIYEGKILINKDPSKKIDFEIKSFSEYFDYKITFEKYYGQAHLTKN